MGDLHQALECMNGENVLTTPSDLPLITSAVFDQIIDYFVPGTMDSLLAVVDEATVLNIGITPSYVHEYRGKRWVLSGVSIINRLKTLNGDYLEESYFVTNWPELSVNVNTQLELNLARSYHRE